MIGLLIPTLAGGGAERVASLLSKGLHELGREVAVVVFEGKVGYPYAGELISLNTPYRGMAAELWRMPRRALALRKLAKEKDIEVVIAFDEVANLTAIISGVPTIATIHRDLERADREKGAKALPLRVLRKLYRKALAVVVPSKAMAAGLSRYLSLPLTAIPNPLPEPPPVEPLGEIHLNIGRLTLQKGQWHLIHAYRRLPYQLHIHGRGPLEGRLREMAAKLPHVEINTEWVEDIYRLYAKAFLNIQTSYYEGFGMVLAEGLSVGLPAVATNVPYGPAEVLGKEREKVGELSIREGGILLPPPPETWGEHPFHGSVRKAVELLVEDATLWKALSRAGKERAKRWHYREIAKEWVAMLKH